MVVRSMSLPLPHVGRRYRIFPFMSLGMLLLGTFVIYGKLTPRLLGKVGKQIVQILHFAMQSESRGDG